MLQKRDAARCFRGVCWEATSDNDSNKETSFGAATHEWALFFCFFKSIFTLQPSHALNPLTPRWAVPAAFHCKLVFRPLSSKRTVTKAINFSRDRQKLRRQSAPERDDLFLAASTSIILPVTWIPSVSAWSKGGGGFACSYFRLDREEKDSLETLNPLRNTTQSTRATFYALAVGWREREERKWKSFSKWISSRQLLRCPWLSPTFWITSGRVEAPGRRRVWREFVKSHGRKTRCVSVRERQRSREHQYAKRKDANLSRRTQGDAVTLSLLLHWFLLLTISTNSLLVTVQFGTHTHTHTV